MALMTERCFFIDFPFFHRVFAPELDFSWEAHKQRLAAFGHNANVTQPFEIKFWKGEDLNSWLMHDQKVLYEAHYGIVLKNDPDYSAALLQANPYHAPFLRHIFPTGEMFQPLAHFLLKVGHSGHPACEFSVMTCEVCGQNEEQLERAPARQKCLKLERRVATCSMGTQGNVMCVADAFHEG